MKKLEDDVSIYFDDYIEHEVDIADVTAFTKDVFEVLGKFSKRAVILQHLKGLPSKYVFITNANIYEMSLKIIRDVCCEHGIKSILWKYSVDIELFEKLFYDKYNNYFTCED